MTREEVRREHKESEGDPSHRAERQRLHRELLEQRMVAEVRKADFVVVNPDHIAVALRYDRDGEAAPVVVARGERLLAERIKQVAREAGVPIFRDVTLARSLRDLPEGAEIPAALYEAVAEILRVGLRDGRAGGQRARAATRVRARRPTARRVAPASTGRWRRLEARIEWRDPHDQRNEVRKAVLPVAGLGTRFLPATKAIPKEMLPLVDTPSIQLIVEECVAAGHRGDHLRHRARQVGDRGSLRSRGRAGGAARAARQDRRPRARAAADGDGALRLGAPGARRAASGTPCCARATAVGDEPFAVVLGDDLLDAEVPGVRQLIDVYEKTGTGVIALKEVPAGQEHMYGIVDGEPAGPRQLEIRKLVEKPAPGTAPSRLAIIGRYVLPPEIFPILAETQAGQGRRDPADRRAGDAVRAARPGRPGGRGAARRRRRSRRLRRGDGALRAQARGHRATRCARALTRLLAETAAKK